MLHVCICFAIDFRVRSREILQSCFLQQFGAQPVFTRAEQVERVTESETRVKMGLDPVVFLQGRDPKN